MTDAQTEQDQPEPDQPEPDQPEPDQPAPPPRRPGTALSVLAALLLVASLVLAVVVVRLSGDLDDARTERRQVEQTASRFAVRSLTYDYEHLEEFKSGVLEFATGKLRREFDQAFSGLRELITATKNRSSVVVKDVFSSPVESGGASAIVVLDQTVDGTAGNRRRLDVYVQLDLVKAAGRWRVDNVINLNFTEPLSGGPPATPDTTVPPPPG